MSNMPIWLCWIVVAILVIISFLIGTEKANFLIAGYNTSSKEEKEKYNSKRLCRVVGCGMGVIAVILGIATFYRFEMPAVISWIIPWGLLGTIIVIEVLAVTICRKKPHASDK